MAKNHVSLRLEQEILEFSDKIQQKYKVERTLVLQYLMIKAISEFKAWDFKRFLKEKSE